MRFVIEGFTGFFPQLEFISYLLFLLTIFPSLVAGVNQELG